MRSRALVISWFHYHPRTGNGHRIMWENWLKLFPIWAKEVDTFYLIDQGMEFTFEDEQRLKEILPNTKILKTPIDSHHWGQFQWAIPQVTEDNMLFLDNDVVITKPGIIDKWFQYIEQTGADFVGSFDGSGGLQELIREKYPIMSEFGNRMGSYYFILTKKLLERIGEYTFEPNYFEPGTVIPELDYVTKENDWHDSFGWFTLKMLASDAKMVAIPDPRQSIYLQPIRSNDETPYTGLWEINKDPMDPENLGYYHIRNGNLANYILTSKASGHEEDYQREIHSVKREILRSLAWFYWMDTEVKHWKQIEELLKDLGVGKEDWDRYMEEFVKYHEL